jgi:putative ABC transport system permease protein
MNSLKVAGFLAFTSIRRGNTGVILLTIFILVIVALNLLFVPGLLGGLVSGANEKVMNTYAGDIVIESSRENGLIRNADQLIASIEDIAGVVAATPRNSLSAEVSFEDERTRCVVYGIHPKREEAVFSIHKSLIEGNYLDAEDRDKILLGIQLAGFDRPELEFYTRSLKKVHAGDKISVTYANGVEKRYTVKGIFYTEYIQTDLEAFVSEKELRAVDPLSQYGATSIHVRTTPDAGVKSIDAQIGSLRDDIKVFTWEDYAGIVRSMTDSFRVINTILDAVNLLIAATTIFIVTYIDVVNRKRQIGIQRAIGITPAAITLAYLIRALFYAIIAATLAILIFIYGAVPLEAQHPFHFPLGDVYLTASTAGMTRTALILLITAFIAALIPVRAVVKTRILDAIWG